MWLAGLGAPQHVGSSWTRDRTCVPALAGEFLTTAPPGKSNGITLFSFITKEARVYQCFFNSIFSYLNSSHPLLRSIILKVIKTLTLTFCHIKIQKRGDICIRIADSLCCTVETNTTLESDYTPIKK